MNLRHLIVREILHRKGSFLVGTLSIVAAAGCLVGALLALEAHDLRTREEMRDLEDAYRKITKKMGFNVLILPGEQDLGRLYADDYASSYMPEEYVTRLAESEIVTINHLLPSLQEKLIWPEERRTVIVIGTRGEVPILHRDPKRPLLEAVPRESAVLGYELHHSLGLDVGDTIRFLGRELTVSKLHGERGTKDDITIWLHLEEAQELLEKEGRINAILALECHCAGDRITAVRTEIEGILPDVKVVEQASKAKARADARDRAAQAAAGARREHEAFAAVLVPLVLAGACFSIGLLALANARDRAPEVGILRALGLGTKDIARVFLGKAAVMGLVGGGIGCLAGFFIGIVWGDVGLDAAAAAEFLQPALLLLLAVLAGAPLVAMAAAWMPAVIASRQDPAEVLREAPG